MNTMLMLSCLSVMLIYKLITVQRCITITPGVLVIRTFACENMTIHYREPKLPEVSDKAIMLSPGPTWPNIFSDYSR